MGEIMGIGLSHYPGPLVAVEHWPSMLQRWVELGRKVEPFAVDFYQRWYQTPLDPAYLYNARSLPRS